MLAVTTDPALGVPVGRHLLLTSFGVTLYTTPLKYVVMLRLSPSCSFSRSASTKSRFDCARLVLRFRGNDGLVPIDDPARLYRDVGGARFLRDAAAFGG